MLLILTLDINLLIKKFFNYYVKKQKYKDFGSCFMLINMKLNKEKIYEKKYLIIKDLTNLNNLVFLK